MNNFNLVQKILLIVAFASLIVFILIAIGGDFPVNESGYFDRKGLFYDVVGPVWRKTGYNVQWHSVIPLVIFLSSLLGVYLFKDK
mgnify:CR=1 FL=1